MGLRSSHWQALFAIINEDIPIRQHIVNAGHNITQRNNFNNIQGSAVTTGTKKDFLTENTTIARLQ